MTARRRNTTACALLALLVLTGAPETQASDALAQLALAGGPVQTVTAAAADMDQGYQRLLIGFFVDGEEKPALFALYDGEDYLIPLRRVLEDTGAELIDHDGVLRVITPGGEVVIERSWLRMFEGSLMVEREALNSLLMMEARFDSQAYAMRVYPPWGQRRYSARAAAPAVKPSFAPASASLRNIRADYSLARTDDRTDQWAEYYLAGNLASGYWQTRVEQNPQNEYRVFDYQWVRDGRQSQVLLGNARFSVHPLVPAVDQTGAQVLWSSKPSDAGQFSLLDADASRQVGAGTRTIRGVGEPGSIAQLRVNGSVVARTRVRLDGSFEFLEVDAPSRGYSEIEVLLLDRLSGTLMERLDYSRRGGTGILSRGQHSLFAALGAEGNALDDNNGDSRGTAGALQWRYGISDALTVELGQQDNGNDTATVAAGSMALGRYWFGSLAYADNTDVDTLELALDGGQGPWRFNLLAREADVSRPGERSSQWSRQLFFRYDVNPGLSLGLSGRDVRTGTQDESFLLPTLGWNNRRNAWVSAAPNSNGDYRIDSRLAPTHQDTLRYTYEDEDHFLDYRHQAYSGVEYYANYREGDRFSARYEAGAILRSDSPMLEQAQLGLVYNESGDAGYLLQWDSRPLSGVYSRLRVSDNAYVNEEVELDTGFTVQWDVSLDLAVTSGRVIPADSTRSGFNSAALVGDITVDFPGLVGSDQIDKISLIVDGASHTARVQNGKYFLDGLAPGVRRVSLDSRYLPIQLSPEAGQQYWVKLENAAATEVPFKLQVRYSVAGKVAFETGEPLPHVQVAVLDDRGRQIRSSHTDQFGLYRVDNLPPGRYRIVLLREDQLVAAREVVVLDSFLFEQDLLLENAGDQPGV